MRGGEPSFRESNALVPAITVSLGGMNAFVGQGDAFLDPNDRPFA
jgi:hypothetical protein